MACILALDTSSEGCSAALIKEGKVTSVYEVVPRDHTRKIIPMIQQVLKESGTEPEQLDAIAFSRGPGSFTGLRICASITQGLAIAHDLPVIPVSSLAILAQGAYRRDNNKTHVVACLDARREEVYWASFELHAELMELVGEEMVIAPADVKTEKGGCWHGAGSGLKSYKAELASNTQVHLQGAEPEAYPLAQDAIEYAKNAWLNKDMVDASLAIPTYLRDNIATPPKNRM